MEILTLVFALALAVTSSSLYRMSNTIKEYKSGLDDSAKKIYELSREKHFLERRVEKLERDNVSLYKKNSSLLSNISKINNFFEGEK